MPTEQVVLRVLGVVPTTIPGDSVPLDGAAPPVVFVNAPKGRLALGDTVDVVLRCRVAGIIPQALPSPG